MNFSNKKALILSIPMILLVVLFGGWFLFRDQKDTQNAPKEPVIAENPTQNPENIQPSTPIDTSNWKTYRNEEYGFEVKYPETWVENQEGGNVFFGSNDSKKIVPLLKLTVEKNRSIKEWIRDFGNNKFSDHTQIISQEEYRVGNSTGTKIIRSTDIGLNEEVVLIQNGEKSLIVFSFSDVKNVSVYYEKIIQTLRLSL